jgi:hypothetical protein
MKIYLAGPMSGIPYFNAPAFKAAAAWWRAEGHRVVNPIEEDEKRLGEGWWVSYATGDESKVAGFDRRKVIAACCVSVCECDAIALLPGWQDSPGARAELEVARAVGLKVIPWA